MRHPDCDPVPPWEPAWRDVPGVVLWLTISLFQYAWVLCRVKVWGPK